MYPNRRKRALISVACAIAITASASSAFARIIGEDGRRIVDEQESQSYSAIGIVVVDNGRSVYGGTGTLVNDQLTVLTAFHNVFHDGKTGPLGQVQAPLRMMHFLVWDRADGKPTYYRIKSIRPFNRNYGFVLADENDLAIVTLQKPVASVRPLSLRALGPGDDGQDLDGVTLVGYTGLTKMVQECRFRERSATYPRSADVLVHDCDSEGNASGGPFLDAGGRIVAIHLGGSPRGHKIPGRPFNPRTNFNVARRITADVGQFVDREDQTH